MTASRRTSPTREVQAVADRLHSAALHLLRRLRTEDFQAALVLPNSLRSALEVWLARIPRIIGVLLALLHRFLG